METICAALVWLAATLTPSIGGAPPSPGHQMAMAQNPLGITEARDGSGTTWLPDDTPVAAVRRMAGDWMLMLHENVFVQEIDVNGPRGAREFGSVNWGMAIADHGLAGGRVTFRFMTSLEPLTVGRCGYPDLFQTGESCRGVPLHDDQHPHDLFMEVAADYRHAIGPTTAIELYGGPAGDPALGPTAYPHRPSAMDDPIAPVSHHWLDATHITFGVVTAGLYGRAWKIESSVFNGREPDDRRYGFDLAPLDSYSGRVSWLPNSHWSVQVSSGHLKDVEASASGAPLDVTRTTASAIYQRVRSDGRLWATTIAWGDDLEQGRHTQAALAETSIDLDARDTVFARAEAVQKTGAELAIADSSTATFTPVKIEGGYTRRAPFTRVDVRIGGAIGVGFVPADLRDVYGGRAAWEGAVFLRVSPAR